MVAFDTANVIGLLASEAMGVGGSLVDRISSLLVPLIAERAYNLTSGLTDDRLRPAMLSHYHAFVPRSY